MIDQARRQRPVRIVRGSVDQVTHCLGRQPTVFGHGPGDLRHPGVDQALQITPLRLGQGAVGEQVHDALVLFALIEPRRDTELIESSAQERAFDEQSGQIEIAGRL